MNGAACADTVPPLIALGATADALLRGGGQGLPHLRVLQQSPTRRLPQHEELLTQIRFPSLPAGTKSAFVKLGRRNALSISRLSVAAVVLLDDAGVITDARIVPGAAQTVWKRAMEAEKGPDRERSLGVRCLPKPGGSSPGY